MRPVDPTDLSRLLGIGRPGSWVLLGLFAATYVTIASLSGGVAMATVEGKLALLLLIATAALLLWPGPDPLPVWRTAVAIVAAAVITESIIWHLDPVGWPGWASWNFGGCTFLMFALALRGRPLAGLGGLLLVTALAVHWSWATGGDPLHGVLLTYQQVITYGAGAFIGIVLRRTARQIAEFEASERHRAAAEASAAAGARQLTAELGHVRDSAVPLLTRIAAGDHSPRTREAARLLEAELRDHIRGRRLATPTMADAARDARRRGVEVVLLDDLDADPAVTADGGGRLDRARAAAVARVEAATGGRLTIRLTGTADDPVLTVADGSRVDSLA